MELELFDRPHHQSTSMVLDLANSSYLRFKSRSRLYVKLASKLPQVTFPCVSPYHKLPQMPQWSFCFIYIDSDGALLVD